MGGGRAPREKGNRFEREVVNRAKAFGLDAQRAYGSNGEAFGEHKDADLLIEGHTVQAKRRKAVPGWIVNAIANTNMMATRGDAGETYFILRDETLFRLLAMRVALDAALLTVPTAVRVVLEEVIRDIETAGEQGLQEG